eukprot:jgi/Tetstr1/429120/TSEL_019082.t1
MPISATTFTARLAQARCCSASISVSSGRAIAAPHPPPPLRDQRPLAGTPAVSVRGRLLCGAAGPSEGELSQIRSEAAGQLDPTCEVKIKSLLYLTDQEFGLYGVPFNDVLAMVNEAYAESPVEYRTGAGTPDEVVNPPGTNTGSCKIFYFAQLHGLAPEAALRLFCEHYRDVLDSPDGDSHANIRAFMKHGWEGVRFSGPALVSRAASEGAAPAEGI